MNAPAASAVPEPETVRLLLIEDNPGDVALTRAALAPDEVGADIRYAITDEPDLTSALARLDETSVDIVLLDLALPDSVGIDTLVELIKTAPDVAVIVLTGVEDEAVGLAALRQGAQDYLMKSEVQTPLLVRAVRYAIERKRTENRLRSMAQTDGLTGLPNRSAFFDRLRQIVAQTRRIGRHCAVMHVDLDHFKDINDNLGHAAGDDLLREVARRLTASVRSTDLVARLGGDEFAVVATNLEEAEAVSVVAQAIVESIAAIGPTLGDNVRTGASLGITVFPLDDASPEDLLHHADLALYKIKHAGRGGYCFYDAEVDAAAHLHQQLQAELRQAVDDDQLVLYYQPIMAADGGAVVAAEALVRWHHPEHGVMPAEWFLPMARKTGLMARLGAKVIEMAGQQSRAWQRAGQRPIPVSINVSVSQCRRNELTKALRRAIDGNALGAQALELEINENELMTERDTILPEMEAVHDLGVPIAIDDFGAGYSSLSYLKRIPANKLKIDRSLIAGIPQSADSVSLIRAIVDLGRNLQMQVVAPGVETEPQKAFLRAAGCGFVQGNYFSPPLDADAFADWYRVQTDRRGPVVADRRMASAGV